MVFLCFGNMSITQDVHGFFLYRDIQFYATLLAFVFCHWLNLPVIGCRYSLFVRQGTLPLKHDIVEITKSKFPPHNGHKLLLLRLLLLFSPRLIGFPAVALVVELTNHRQHFFW